MNAINTDQGEVGNELASNLELPDVDAWTDGQDLVRSVATGNCQKY